MCVGKIMRRTTDSPKGVSRRAFLRASVTGTTALFGSTAFSRSEAGAPPPVIPEGGRVGLRRVADEPLQQPVAFETASDVENRHYIVDQTGRIHVLTSAGVAREPFLDVRDKLKMRVDSPDERGLLGLALHPEFRMNRRFYVRYSAPPRASTPRNFDHTAVLSEFRANEDLLAADPDSERTILEIPEPQANHNAGDVEFGPDGYLYVPFGDGGGARDTGRGHAVD